MTRVNLPPDAGLGVRLIESALTPEFAQQLLDAARARAAVEELFAFAVPEYGVPQVLASASTNAGHEERVDRYLHHFFFHDPLIQKCRSLPSDCGFQNRTRSVEIAAYDYRELCFDAPGYDEKRSFGWKSEDKILLLNFYRSGSFPDEAAQDGLQSLAEVSLAALHRRLELVGEANSSGIIADRLERRFQGLTGRELDVCTHTLLGKTARETALLLGISETSVITYRRRAYARCGARTGYDLVPHILA